MGDILLMPLRVPTPERMAEIFALADEAWKEREIRHGVSDLPWPRPRLRVLDAGTF